LHTAGEAKRAGQVGFAGTAVAHQKNVLLAIQVFTGHELSNQLLVNGWLKTKIKRSVFMTGNLALLTLLSAALFWRSSDSRSTRRSRKVL